MKGDFNTPHRTVPERVLCVKGFLAILGQGIFCTPDFCGVSCLKSCWYMVNYKCPEKRSQALRGRNLTRDIRADSVPMVHLALGDQGCRGPFFMPLDTGVMPQKSCVSAAFRGTSNDVTLRYFVERRHYYNLMANSCGSSELRMRGVEK